MKNPVSKVGGCESINLLISKEKNNKPHVLVEFKRSDNYSFLDDFSDM